MTTDPLTVRLGVLTRKEFDSVSRAVQQGIEDSGYELRRQYPESWFTRDRARLRWELEFAYGVTLDPDPPPPAAASTR